MTQEDKQLLLVDLCARLPYGVIGKYSWKGREPYNRELTGNLYDELKSSWNSTGDSEFFPYLRPMSSMTEEEKLMYEGLMVGTADNISYMLDVVDWLNKKMFDYRGLIEKGLAFEAPEGMKYLRENINKMINYLEGKE